MAVPPPILDNSPRCPACGYPYEQATPNINVPPVVLCPNCGARLGAPTKRLSHLVVAGVLFACSAIFGGCSVFQISQMKEPMDSEAQSIGMGLILINVFACVGLIVAAAVAIGKGRRK